MFQLIIQKIVRRRSEVVVGRILPYLKKTKSVIDIGCGTGDVAFLLRQRGKNATPVDVADFHGPRLVKPVIFDGQKLPFADKHFDTALLLMVLHHTPDPKMVFSEAARVAKELVVIETSYTTQINRWLTVVSDTISNLRLHAFWSSYKSDGEWRKFFEDKGFRVVDTEKCGDHNFGLPFLHIVYYLRRK